jgi:hypothetical protein
MSREFATGVLFGDVIDWRFGIMGANLLPVALLFLNIVDVQNKSAFQPSDCLNRSGI